MSKRLLYTVFLTIILLLGTNIFTYKVASEKTSFEHFLYEINHSILILQLLDENRIYTAKKLFMGDIGRVFFEAGQTDDLDKFSPICEFLTDESMQRYKKYDNEYNTTIPEHIELNKIVESGEKKLIGFCKNKL